MNLSRKDDQDYTDFASVVNKYCDDFKLAELSADNFKVLIFVQGLVSSQDTERRRRVLNKLENEPNLTLQQLAKDCQHFVTVRQDYKAIEESGVSHIKKYETKSRASIQKKEVKPKINRINYHLDHVLDAEYCIGIMTAVTKIRNA